MGNRQSAKEPLFKSFSRRVCSEKALPVSINQIVFAKKTALRHNIWFNVLSRVERAILDLTARYVDRIKSAKLAQIVSGILEKLELAVETNVDRMVRTVGFSLAQKISNFALGLGYGSAGSWAADAGFARFLTIMRLNGSGVGV
jgi:hypothetical protein